MYTEKLIPAITPDSTVSLPAVGMILLSTDLTCERDYRWLARRHDLEFDLFANRIHFENPMTVQSLSAMLNDLGMVAADILPGCELDAIVFNCTSASAILGGAAVSEAILRGKPNTPVLTTASAGVQYIMQSGYKTISLLAPYSAEVSRSVADYFESRGLDIVSLSYMDIADDRNVAKLDSQTIIEAACAAVEPGTEALFISCTAMRAAEILPEIERAAGVPVVSSNFCSFWQTMRLIGLAE